MHQYPTRAMRRWCGRDHTGRGDVPDVTKYEFRSLDGSDLPEWSAGRIWTSSSRRNSCGNIRCRAIPADRSDYQIGVLREDAGAGRRRCMHRIFSKGARSSSPNRSTISNWTRRQTSTFLMGGGIGITPMIALAHRLHAIGADFELHYSMPNAGGAGYLERAACDPWADRVHLHVSDEGSRCDLAACRAISMVGTSTPAGRIATWTAVDCAAEAGRVPG